MIISFAGLALAIGAHELGPSDASADRFCVGEESIRLLRGPYSPCIASPLARGERNFHILYKASKTARDFQHLDVERLETTCLSCRLDQAEDNDDAGARVVSSCVHAPYCLIILYPHPLMDRRSPGPSRR